MTVTTDQPVIGRPGFFDPPPGAEPTITEPAAEVVDELPDLGEDQADAEPAAEVTDEQAEAAELGRMKALAAQVGEAGPVAGRLPSLHGVWTGHKEWIDGESVKVLRLARVVYALVTLPFIAAGLLVLWVLVRPGRLSAVLGVAGLVKIGVALWPSS